MADESSPAGNIEWSLRLLIRASPVCRTRPSEMPGTALLDALEPGMEVRAVYLHPMTLGPLLDTWATGHPEPRRSRTARAVVPLSAHRHQRPNSISPTPRSATPTFCAGSERATCCPESIQSGMRVMIKAPTSTVKGPCRGLDRASRTRSRRNRQSLRPRESVSRNGTVLRLHYDRWSRTVQSPLTAVIVSRHGASRLP